MRELPLEHALPIFKEILRLRRETHATPLRMTKRCFLFMYHLYYPDFKLQQKSLMKPKVEIQYCTQCRWLPRACWMAQELLTTFQDELGGVTLAPATGGTFDVFVDGDLIYSRKQEGRFPESKELKQLVRDCIAPGKDLGHSDR